MILVRIGNTPAAHNISEETHYAWKRNYVGMDVSETRRLRALENKNAHLKRNIADLSVQMHILKEVNLKEVNEKKW